MRKNYLPNNIRMDLCDFTYACIKKFMSQLPHMVVIITSLLPDEGTRWHTVASQRSQSF